MKMALGFFERLEIQQKVSELDDASLRTYRDTVKIAEDIAHREVILLCERRDSLSQTSTIIDNELYRREREPADLTQTR